MLRKVLTGTRPSRSFMSSTLRSSPASRKPDILRHYRQSTRPPQAFHRLSKQRAVIPQDHLRRVVAGRTGDAAAGMAHF
jgi:hypothetical protein